MCEKERDRERLEETREAVALLITCFLSSS
jgi:hypothetical protein